MKQKNFFNEIEYDKLYPLGSARIYGTPKMHKFSSSDSFPRLHPIVSSMGTFNYNLPSFLCDLLSPLVSHYYSCKDTFSFVSQTNPIQDGLFWGYSRMGWGQKGTPVPKICHTYPTMMKLGTVIPYPKKIQKIYESRDTFFEFCWHQHLFNGNQQILLYHDIQI